MRQVIDEYLYNDNESYLIVADFGKFPLMEKTDRYINVGLSETLLVNTAIGLASCRKHVYVYSAANFVLYRAYEQIKLYFNKNLNITFLNGGAGFCYAGCGIGHYLLDDINVALQLNLKCLLPYNRDTTIQCLSKAKTGINYIRLCLDNTEDFKLKNTIDAINVVSFGWLIQMLSLIKNQYNCNINIIPIVNLYKFKYENKYISIYDNELIPLISNNTYCIYTHCINKKHQCIGYTRDKVLKKYHFDIQSILDILNNHEVL